MADVIDPKVEDLSFEHSQHFTYQEGCSTCWSENIRMDVGERLTEREQSTDQIDDPRFNENPLE